MRDPLPAAVLSRLSGLSRIFLVGTGTSYHGALVGQYLMRSAGVEAWAIPAFEFVNYPPRIKADDGLLLLSHRGTKRFSQAALEAFDHREHWLAITGDGSPLHGPGVINTVAQERSPVHTASHTGAMVRLAQLAVGLGSRLVRHSGHIDHDLHARARRRQGRRPHRLRDRQPGADRIPHVRLHQVRL